MVRYAKVALLGMLAGLAKAADPGDAGFRLKTQNTIFSAKLFNTTYVTFVPQCPDPKGLAPGESTFTSALVDKVPVGQTMTYNSTRGSITTSTQAYGDFDLAINLTSSHLSKAANVKAGTRQQNQQAEEIKADPTHTAFFQPVYGVRYETDTTFAFDEFNTTWPTPA
ncbi:MAG: hypothetical protein M1838_003108 [Thelocarpon superellum]|nr:MAG: hypothetical protein M1838_003108 [Thelocarpon superellum]